MRLLILFLLCIAIEAQAPDVRLYGVADSELNVTPANSASLLNPDNFLGITPWANSSSVTVFGELVPSDKRWKLHVKLRDSQDLGHASTAQLGIDELNLSVSITPWLDFKIGRTIEKWGTGYAWNPTGVINPPKNPEDPTDRNSAFRGVDMMSIDLFLRHWDVSLVGVPDISWTGRGPKRLLATGWAARAYRLVNGTDVAFTGSGGSGLANSGGLSLARVFGNALELHAEAVYKTDTIRYLPEDGSFRPFRRPDGELLLGGQYTFPRGVNMVTEYFHSEGGLNASEWSAFQNTVLDGQTELRQGDPTALLAANTQFAVLNMGRDYSFIRVLWPIIYKKLELETIVVNSLHDGSGLIRPGLTWHARPNWSVYWIQTEFLGNAYSEFGHIQIKRESDIGVRYNFSLLKERKQ